MDDIQSKSRSPYPSHNLFLLFQVKEDLNPQINPSLFMRLSVFCLSIYDTTLFLTQMAPHGLGRTSQSLHRLITWQTQIPNSPPLVHFPFTKVRNTWNVPDFGRSGNSLETLNHFSGRESLLEPRLRDTETKTGSPNKSKFVLLSHVSLYINPGVYGPQSP